MRSLKTATKARLTPKQPPPPRIPPILLLLDPALPLATLSFLGEIAPEQLSAVQSGILNLIKQITSGYSLDVALYVRARPIAPLVPPEPASRPETETEDDGDQDIDGDIEMSQDTDENVPPPNRG